MKRADANTAILAAAGLGASEMIKSHDAAVKAVQEVTACAQHRERHACRGVPKARCRFAAEHAAECDTCARSVVNAVLVAAREGETWVRAVPLDVLVLVDDEDWNDDSSGPYRDACHAELIRREREEGKGT